MKTLKIGDVVVIELKDNNLLNNTIGIVLHVYGSIVVVEAIWRYGYWYLHPTSLTKIGNL
jgi:hypothetical protein